MWHGSRLSNYVGILSQGAHCLAFHSFVLCPGGAQVYNYVLRLPCLAFAQHAEHRYSVTTASVCLLLPCLFSIYNFCADTLRAQCLKLTLFCGVEGLRIAPPEAPVTGYMFDKGVYFADCVSKSANYCFTNKHAPAGVMLLCEVALGDQHEMKQANYHANTARQQAGKQSVKGADMTLLHTHALSHARASTRTHAFFSFSSFSFSF